MRSILTCFLILFGLTILFTNCKYKNEKLAEKKVAGYFAIFRVELNLGNDSFISAVVFKDNRVYYFKNDTLLLRYKALPFKKAQLINDENLIDDIRSLSAVNFKAVNVKKCNCKAKSMGQIVIRGSAIDPGEFVMNKVGDCNFNRDCRSIDVINAIFFKLDKQ
ncbi:MAG TPA: hypothetical protein VG367_03205 [Mucilaginibacter sp.]|jgi:hypothetical protein|nr:hypothetical protein [Mucilaginibacter sp.]